MNISDYVGYLGKLALYRVSTSQPESVIKRRKDVKPVMFVRVRVVDIRSSYNHAEFKIEAVAGSGCVWVRENSLTFIKESEGVNA